MLNYFCINKSGIKIPVYSDTPKTSQIGLLMIVKSLVTMLFGAVALLLQYCFPIV